jgi:hypothetical protein
MSSHNSKAVVLFYVVIVLLMISGYAFAEDVTVQPPSDAQPTIEPTNQPPVSVKSAPSANGMSSESLQRARASRSVKGLTKVDGGSKPHAKISTENKKLNADGQRTKLQTQKKVINAKGVEHSSTAKLTPTSAPLKKKDQSGSAQTITPGPQSAAHPRTVGGESPKIKPIKHTKSTAEVQNKAVSEPHVSKEGIHNPKANQTKSSDNNTDNTHRPPSRWTK